MKKVCYLLACFFLLAGCSAKAVPDWTKTSHNQLESFKKHYLQGKDHLAEINFLKAIDEIKTSGDLRLLQIAYLTRYAVQIAVLGDVDDHEYLRLANVEPDYGNAQFHIFLKGAFDRLDEASLPQQYRSFLHACKTRDQVHIDHAIAAIKDPLSRLIASGLAVQKQLYHEKTITEAVRTASAQGWKKALLAYLEKLRDDYQAGGEREKADLTQQKIDLIH
jgi:molecular chaperone DnaK (HSP70)